jgi:succinyl-diaminopimelate desuccinylase
MMSLFDRLRRRDEPLRLHGADGAEWVQVRGFAQRWEAEMIQGFLESHEIATWLPADDGGTAVYPGVSLVGYPVMVRDADVETAREVLAAEAADPEAVSRQADGADPDVGDVDDGDRAGGSGGLVDLCFDLVAIPSVTGAEGDLADRMARHYERLGERVQRSGNSLVVGNEDPDRPTVLLVGHLDTVPPTDADAAPREEDGVLVGRGASDMKGGLAVAMDCFEDTALRDGPRNLLLVAYAGEEGPHETNELGALIDAVGALADADLAVVLEPTDLTVQLGCLGTLHAEVTVRGRAAHSARPWHGENALTKAAGLLAELDRLGPVDVDVDGLVYREVLTATQGWTDNARNVVPERFTVNLNYRFAPDKRVDEAEAALRGLAEPHGAVVVTDRAPAARPHRDSPLVAAFVGAVGAAVEPKQA